MLTNSEPPSAVTTLQYAFVALCMAAVMLAITLILVGLLLFFLVGSELLRFTRMFLPALMAVLMGIFGIVAHRVVFLAVGHRNTIFHASGVSYATTVLPFCVAANLIAAVGIIATLVVQAGHVEEYEGRIFKSMLSYSTVTRSKVLMDDLQILLQCCGSNGYQDYFSVDWAGTDVLPYDEANHESNDRSHVPFSCCKTNILKPCIQNDLMISGLDTINQEGCAPALVEQRSLIALIMAILFLSMGIMQIAQVCFSRTMVDPELPTADSVVCHQEKVEKREEIKPETSTKSILRPKDLASTTVSGEYSSTPSQIPDRNAEKHLNKIQESDETDFPKVAASAPIKLPSNTPAFRYPHSAERITSTRNTSRKRPNAPKNVESTSEYTPPLRHLNSLHKISKDMSARTHPQPSTIDKTLRTPQIRSSPRYPDATEKTTPISILPPTHYHSDTTGRASPTSSINEPQEYTDTVYDTSTISPTVKYTSSETGSLRTENNKHVKLPDDQIETTVPESSSEEPTDSTGVISTSVESDSNTRNIAIKARFANIFLNTTPSSQANIPAIEEMGQSDESDSRKSISGRRPTGWPSHRHSQDDYDDDEEEEEEEEDEYEISSQTENTRESHDEDFQWKPFQIPPESSSDIKSDDTKTRKSSSTKPSDQYEPCDDPCTTCESEICDNACWSGDDGH